MSGAGLASNEPLPWTPRSVRAGEWRITALTDGFLRLDGGSMWGVVPKNLWARMTPPEYQSRISSSAHAARASQASGFVTRPRAMPMAASSIVMARPSAPMR